MRRRELGVRHIEFVSPRRRERIASSWKPSGSLRHRRQNGHHRGIDETPPEELAKLAAGLMRKMDVDSVAQIGEDGGKP